MMMKTEQCPRGVQSIKADKELAMGLKNLLIEETNPSWIDESMNSECPEWVIHSCVGRNLYDRLMKLWYVYNV